MFRKRKREPQRPTDESRPDRTRRSRGDRDGSGTQKGERPPASERMGRDLDPTEATAGRDAQSPGGLGAKGWKASGKRVVTELKRDHVSLLAAGVAFKGLLALFPAIVAALTIWGLFASPQQMSSQVSSYMSALPQQARGLIEDQMSSVAQSGTGTLSIALAVSVLLALWSASGGMAGLVEGCNAAYDEVDERKFPAKRGLALVLTLGAIVFLAITIALIAVLPAVIGGLGLGSTAELVVKIAQWPVLAVVVIVSLAVVYKVGPDRDRPQTRWVSWGAAVATILWLAGSALFTLYVQNFGSFGETYGAFAGIIVLMLWLFLSAFIFLIGAEINAELERQTRQDTTVGEPEPLGTRGAVSADTTPSAYQESRR